MPVIYVPGDGSYYVTDDGLGHVTKTKVGGLDATQEPGYVHQTASTSSGHSTSSSTSQNFSDPEALRIQARQVDAQIEESRRNYDLAVKNGDRQAQQWEATRQDGLNRDKASLTYQYATLTQGGDIAAANRALTASEGGANRAASASESALNRALTAGQFAATLAQQREQMQMQADQNYQNAMEQYANDRIAGAKTVAGLVNSVDPTALPAFYKAGGGNIANAIHEGASAVSDRAVAPAAQALRANTERAVPTRFVFDNSGTGRVDPSAYGTPPAAAPAAAATQAAPRFSAAIDPTISAQGAALAPGLAAATANSEALASGQPARFAFGTQDGPIVGSQQEIAGDSTDPSNPAADGARPEAVTVNDPTNDAQVSIDPLVPPGGGDDMPRFADVLRAIAEMIDPGSRSAQAAPGPKRFAYGTDPFLEVNPGDEPYMQQIRDIRANADYPVLNPYSTKYRFESPTMRAAFLSGRQAQYGVPVEDQQQQIDQYQVPTASRGAFSMGV